MTNEELWAWEKELDAAHPVTGTCDFCGFEGQTKMYHTWADNLSIYREKRTTADRLHPELCWICANTTAPTMDKDFEYWEDHTRDLAKIIIFSANTILAAINSLKPKEEEA